MTAKDRYNKLINDIESNAGNADLSALQLNKKITKSLPLSPRDINVIMEYLSGSTLLNYIKERKIMAAYRFLMDSKDFDVDTALEMAGYDNQSSFTKRFTERFGLPPRKAYDAKDLSLIRPPMTWDIISCRAEEREEPTMPPKEETLFGISQQQYEKIMAAQDLQALYDLSPRLSNTAFDLAESLSVPLENAFEFIYTLLCGIDDDVGFPDRDDPADAEECVLKIAADPCARTAYFKYNISAFDIALLRRYLPRGPFRFRELCQEIISAYENTCEMTWDYFLRAWDYYHENATDEYGDDNLDEYLEAVNCGVYYETAFDEIIPFNEDDIDYNYDWHKDPCLNDDDYGDPH